MKKTILLGLFAALALGLMAAGRSDEHRDTRRTTPTPTATDTAAPTDTNTAPPPATSGPCDTPPPWSDQATAERCWTHYPPPFGGVIVQACQLGYSPLGDLICYGYWVIPYANYPWLTATPAGGYPTPQPSRTPPAYP